MPKKKPEKLLAVGEKVRILATKQHGTVEKVETGQTLPVITVRGSDGYAARYNINQLTRL